MKKLLFIGDVVGKAGCDFLTAKLGGIKRQHGIDITIVNGENSANGKGLRIKEYDRIKRSGENYFFI